MPHDAMLVVANLSNLASAAENALNNAQASWGGALRLPAAWIAARRFVVSSRSLRNSWRQGGICWCVYGDRAARVAWDGSILYTFSPPYSARLFRVWSPQGEDTRTPGARRTARRGSTN